MSCVFRLVGIICLLAGFGFGLVGTGSETPAPEIVMLTCNDYVVMDYRPMLGFAWRVQNAAAVRVESGYLDDQGVFQPGGWHVAEDLPPQGSGSFFLKTNNNAVRVCITEPESARNPVCEVCTPFATDDAE